MWRGSSSVKCGNPARLSVRSHNLRTVVMYGFVASARVLGNRHEDSPLSLGTMKSVLEVMSMLGYDVLL